MAANRKVEILLNQKNKIERELRDMQLNCKHIEQTIKQVSERDTQTVTRWVCNNCAAVVGYPTDNEIKKYLE